MSNGFIPADESLVVMYSQKDVDDTYVFVEGVNSFKYLSSDVDYGEEED
jgi:hypothetical protein